MNIHTALFIDILGNMTRVRITTPNKHNSKMTIVGFLPRGNNTNIRYAFRRWSSFKYGHNNHGLFHVGPLHMQEVSSCLQKLVQSTNLRRQP